MNKCPQCGTPIDGTISNCKYCGEKLSIQPTAPQPAQQQVQYSLDPGIDPAWPMKNKLAAGLLGIFLGGFGIHKFYMGRTGWGIVYLLFCWTYIPGIIGFVEGLIYLLQTEHNFQVKNKVRIR